MEGGLDQKILNFLAEREELDTLNFAKEYGCDHQKLIGAVKSLLSSPTAYIEVSSFLTLNFSHHPQRHTANLMPDYISRGIGKYDFNFNSIIKFIYYINILLCGLLYNIYFSSL